jgi:hypothetical protein
MAQGYGAGQGGIREIVIIIGVIMAIILWIMSCIGWYNFPIGGGGGFQLKMICTVIIGATIVGLLFIAYWTGNCVLRLFRV